MTATDLENYVGATPGDAFVATCWDEAYELVTQYVGTDPVTAEPRAIPPATLRRACLEVGSELFHRQKAPNGVAQFATMDASPIRVARDPMVGAYPILNRFLPGGFA